MIILQARVLLIAIISASLLGCGSSFRPDSPDVRYRSAEEYELLQLPPDVAGERGQQYVIPSPRVAISRADTLPLAESVRFERQGEISWLQVASTVDELWPQLVGFAESEQYPLDVNDSLAGLLVTSWQQPEYRVSRSGLMQKLIGDKTSVNKDELERFVIRVERTDENTSRVFARFNLYKKEKENGKNAWRYKNDDENRSAELLTRLMVWLGVEEQKAKGLLSEKDVQSIRQNILLETSENQLSYILFWQDYESAFQRVKNAVENAGLKLDGDNINDGTIDVKGSMAYLDTLKSRQQELQDENKNLFDSLVNLAGREKKKNMELELRFLRVQSGVYAVDVRDPEIGIIEGEEGRLILESLRDALITS